MKKTYLVILMTILEIADGAFTGFDYHMQGSILNFGAVPDQTDPEVERLNCVAFMEAARAANNSTAEHGRRVIIPAGYTFSMMPQCETTGLENVEIVIDGKVLLSKNMYDYPADVRTPHLFDISDSKNLTIAGSGSVDGQGWSWWFKFAFNSVPMKRPKLFKIKRCQDCEFTGIKLLNSPNSFIHFTDSDRLYIHDFEIEVDPWRFHKDFFKFAWWFPFNTDGIDLAASNVLIERLNITNFDDAVVVKRSTQDNLVSKCSENITIRDIDVHYSTGMAIGSISPSDSYSCVRNVTFRDIDLHSPFKAVYIKTNPGSTSSMEPGSGGEIANIRYENINIERPLWWGIYIGP